MYNEMYMTNMSNHFRTRSFLCVESIIPLINVHYLHSMFYTQRKSVNGRSSALATAVRLFDVRLGMYSYPFPDYGSESPTNNLLSSVNATTTRVACACDPYLTMIATSQYG